MGVVSKEVATKEVNAWVEFQGIEESQKEDLKNTINKLVDAVCNGNITINLDTFVITQKLKFPIGSEVKIKELVYQPSITVGDVQKHLKGVDSADRYSNVYAHIAAATGEPKSVISLLNLKDYNLSDSIIVFFML